jgi:hypothetical protein
VFIPGRKISSTVKLMHLNATFASARASVKFYNFLDCLVVTADADTHIKANKRDNIV